MDKTGLTIVQHVGRKIMEVKGKCQVHRISCTERGSLVTTVTCMSASGQFIPPVLDFSMQELQGRTAQWNASWNNLCHSSLWVDTARLIHKTVPGFHQHCQTI